MTPPTQEVRHGRDDEINAIQLARRGAGLEQTVLQGRYEPEPLPGPAHDGASAQASR